jgi:hypothetical protein
MSKNLSSSAPERVKFHFHSLFVKLKYFCAKIPRPYWQNIFVPKFPVPIGTYWHILSSYEIILTPKNESRLFVSTFILSLQFS